MEIILEEIIEALRLQLDRESFVQGSLTHEKVVALSQELDKYITIYQKLKAKLSIQIIFSISLFQIFLF
jgi:hypothetical protein